MTNYVYDIETYPNFFCAVFRNKDDHIVFEISSRKDESKNLLEFLNSGNIKYLIGFNNIRFDMQVLHFFQQEILLYKNLSGKDKALLLYQKGQEIIEITSDKPDGERGGFPPYAEWNFSIPQIDLFKIMHIENKARRCSLKWMEFTMRWHKVQDLPYHHGVMLEENTFDEVIDYCKNDVDFTRYLAETRKNDIKFRISLSKKFEQDLIMNFDDVKIGEYINRVTYSELTGLEYDLYKHLRTIQNEFDAKDLIHPIIKFKTPKLQAFLEKVRASSFLDQDDDDKYKFLVDIGDMTLSFMKGGIHSEDPPRMVIRKEGWHLKEKDVGGMYPETLINHHFYPRHLREEWVMGLKQNSQYRNNVLKPKMKKLEKFSPAWEQVNVEQGGYKLSLNGGGYGKLGSNYSWQCDALQKYKVTFFGQLTLMMLMEELDLIGVTLISANTDGIVIEYPDSLHDEVERVCKEWEEKTMYILEDTYYKKLIQSNVNNYIAVITDENYKETTNIKHKGKNFIIDIEDTPWKNNSQRIIPIALKEYFINGVNYKDVIKNIGYEFEDSKNEKQKTDIYDYCLGIKITRNQKAFIQKRAKYSSLKGDQVLLQDDDNREYVTDKILRYYVINDFDEKPLLFREYIAGKAEGSIIAVQKGYPIQPFMDYKKKDDYNILYQYYINEIEKIIKPIERHEKLAKQLSFF